MNRILWKSFSFSLVQTRSLVTSCKQYAPGQSDHGVCRPILANACSLQFSWSF
uniref:Uncharacterized protein n=1 Tax=Arundo donax TaxID=35708 RepID=A0A0A9AJ47_ARUDO